MNKEKRKLIIKHMLQVGIVLAIFIMFFLAGMDNKFVPYVGFIGGILGGSVLILSYGFPQYLASKVLLNSKRIYLKVSGIAIMLGYSLIVIGAIIAFTSYGFEGLYDVDEVEVISVEKNKLIVDYTKYNNDDYMTIKIRKPIYINIKSEDKIYVRYPYNKPQKMHCIIGKNRAKKIASIGFKLEVFGLLIISLYILLKSAKKKIKKKGNRK